MRHFQSPWITILAILAETMRVGIFKKLSSRKRKYILAKTMLILQPQQLVSFMRQKENPLKILLSHLKEQAYQF